MGRFVAAAGRTVVKDRDAAEALADEYEWCGYKTRIEALESGHYLVKVLQPAR